MTAREGAYGSGAGPSPTHRSSERHVLLGPAIRGLVARLLPVCVAAGFLLLLPVGLIALLGHRPTQAESQLLLLVVPVAGITLLLYLRVKPDIDSVAGRLLRRRARPADELLQSMKSWLHDGTPIEDLLVHIVTSLRDDLSLAAAEAWTVSGDRLVRHCSSPERVATTLTLTDVAKGAMANAGVARRTRLEMWIPELLTGRDGGPLCAAPMTHAGALQGIVVAERARGAQPFDVDDEDVLSEVARQLALILALEASFEALRESRARLVASADEARRHIEKDLHDGAQNQLIVILGTLEKAAEKLDAQDTSQARDLVKDATEGLEESVQELRRLAHGIYPPVLVNRGLPDALRSAARQVRLHVDVEAVDVGRFEREVETATYFCSLEALQNVKKHAGEEPNVAIKLWSASGILHFTVADDGQGFEPSRRSAGAGLTNMRDRLEAVGGRLSVHSRPGCGCTVEGEIPVLLPGKGSPRVEP